MAKPVRRSGGEQYHHGDLREALVTAAREILDEGGEVTLRAVARRSGVSHAAPYHHFADRRALIAAIATDALVDFRGVLQAAMERHPELPPMQMFEIGMAYVRFAVEHPARFRLMFSEELASRDELPQLQRAYDEAYGIVAQVSRNLLGPAASDEAVSNRALAAWSQVHGLAMLILDNQVGVPRTTAEADAITRAVLMVGATPAERRG